MQANTVIVERVENGWVVRVVMAGTSVTLVAKVIEEVSSLLEAIEWRDELPRWPDAPTATSEVGAGGTFQANTARIAPRTRPG